MAERLQEKQMRAFDQGFQLLDIMIDLRALRAASGQSTEALDKTITRHSISMVDFLLPLLRQNERFI